MKSFLPALLLPAALMISCGGEKTESKTLAIADAPVFDSLAILNDTTDGSSIRHTPASIAVFRKVYQELAAAAKADRPLRILHYGDSQIEADRITGMFREKMQEQFGGFGAGLLPVSEVSEARVNVLREYSRNWAHYDLHLKKNAGVPDNKYGYAATVHRFGELSPGTGNHPESWLRLKSNARSRSNERKAEYVSIFYRNNWDNAACTVQCDTQLVAEKELEKSAAFHVFRTKLPAADLDKIQLTFSSPVSPDIFGISLESANGVIVDNISMRGSSAVEFTHMDSLFLRDQLKAINARIIFFQFGTNLVPNVLKDYGYYEELFFKQLAMFRRMAPDAAIIVIGVPDMARKVKGKYTSYPNIPAVLAAQRNAARRAGCAFWDLHKVMGGENAMATWVRNGLGNRDYVHFSNQGADRVGELMYEALLKDFGRFGKEEKKIQPKQLAGR